jgi:hypothetical protein
MRVVKRLLAGLFLASIAVHSGWAQRALTWQEVRDKFGRQPGDDNPVTTTR